MSTAYHLHKEHPLYFTTTTILGWIDLFTRPVYRDIIYQSLRHCQAHKGLQIHGYVLMTNHLHMLVSSQGKPLKDIFRDFKKYTAKQLANTIQENVKESRKKWIRSMMELRAKNSSRHKYVQVWKVGNHAIPLWTEAIIWQKLAYIHQNPVKAGWVDEAWHFKHSSARAYQGLQCELEIDLLWS